jgi:hypothetical protein
MGHLTIVEELGRLGNGVAFLCSGDTAGEVVAKVYIPPSKRDLDNQSLGRFRNEVKLASTVLPAGAERRQYSFRSAIACSTQAARFFSIWR